MIALAVALAACLPTADAYVMLSDRYGEQRIVAGLTPDGAIAETWADPEDGSWSALLTRPDGITCMTGAGTAAQVMQVMPPGDPA